MLLGISGLAGSGKDTVADFLRALGFISVAMADPLKRIVRSVYDFSEEQLWGPSSMRNAPDERYPRPAHEWGEPVATQDGGWTITCACCGHTRPGEGMFVEYVGMDPPPHRKEGVVRCYLTPRYALQGLGTEWGRHCYPNTWAAVCLRTSNLLLRDPELQYNRIRGLWALPNPNSLNVEDIHTREEAVVVKGVSIPDVRFRNELGVIREGGGKIIRVKRPGSGLKGPAGLHQSEAEQLRIGDHEFDGVIENVGTLEELQAKAHELIASLRAAG